MCKPFVRSETDAVTSEDIYRLKVTYVSPSSKDDGCFARSFFFFFFGVDHFTDPVHYVAVQNLMLVHRKV